MMRCLRLTRAVAVFQSGRVFVCCQRPFIQFTPGQRAHAVQVGLDVCMHIRRQVQRQQRGELRIAGVQIAAVAVRDSTLAGLLSGLL